MMKALFSIVLLCSAAFGAHVNSSQIFVSDGIIEITDDNFELISESKKPVILDVNAAWCGPCRQMAPIFDQLSEEYGDAAVFAKMDFDSHQKLAIKLGVSALPTILFFKAGHKKPSVRSVGLLNKEQLKQKIDDFLGK